MSRLTNLLRRVHELDSQLATDLKTEVDALTHRRAFGLNFERHIPETVELPNRQVRRGDKVRFLPERGNELSTVDKKVWRVHRIERGGGNSEAYLISQENHEEPLETARRAVDDLIVVAEFRDPIFPGLVSTGRIERGDDKPFHAVINAENFHALQLLLYTHEGKIDAIYIDPPYNTGARDWKYNNDFVDADDRYRHSKWLAMMERRLKLAARLLNPSNSILIVAIDDKEFARLGMLLEQIFPNATQDMITTVINSRGRYRQDKFARCEEYLFFLMFGEARVLGEPDEDSEVGDPIRWSQLRRTDLNSVRGAPKGGTSQFYPIYVNASGCIEHIGDPLEHGVDRSTAPELPGCVAVFPIRDDETEMNWGLIGSSLKSRIDNGYVRVGEATPDKPQKYRISYLTSGRIEDIESGKASVVGREQDGSVIAKYAARKTKMPKSTWNRRSHNAEQHGTNLVKILIGERAFPFPKSLFAVEDCLRLFISDKPNATVLDFFSGSGTTAHAVMRLNSEDKGSRQSISVTNNEVAEKEQTALRDAGLRPGDLDWEKWGIYEYITKPRVKAAITGTTPTGLPIKESYKFGNEFPISDGFRENVEFFTITYEAPQNIAHNRAFNAIAPLLWLKAGSQGCRIEDATSDFAVADNYAVLFDLDASKDFLISVVETDTVRMAFIVTDDDRGFQTVCSELPSRIEAVRIYESYLTNFMVNTARG